MPIAPRLMRTNLPSLVLITGLTLSALTAHFAYKSSTLSAQYRFQEIAERIRHDISNRIQIYINAISQTSGLLQIDHPIGRDEFKTYTTNMNLPLQYPGIMGLGFAQGILVSDIPRWTATIRREYHNPQLEVWPLPKGLSPQDKLDVNRFFEPEITAVNGRNVIGFHVGSEPVHREAFALARDSGRPVLSRRMQLIQNPDAGHSGYLLIVPVYRLGRPIKTLEQRREANIGFITAAFLARDLFNGIFAEDLTRRHSVDFEIFDGPAGEHPGPANANLIYRHSDGRKVATQPLSAAMMPEFAVFDVAVGNRSFTVRVFPLASFKTPLGRIAPLVILLGGIIASFIIHRMLRLNQDQANKFLKSEKQLRLVTDALPVLISYIDTNRHYRFNNRAYQTWFNLLRDEISGHTIDKVLGPRNYAWLKPFVDRALQGESVSFEGLMELPDGSKRPVLANYVPDFSAKGKVRGFVTLISDIAERKRQEENSRFLAELSTVLGASLDVETTLNRFAALVTPMLGDWCTIDLVDESGRLKRVAATSSDPTQREILSELARDFPPRFEDQKGPGRVTRTGEPVLFSEADPEEVDDIKNQRHLDILHGLGMKSAMIVPLKTRGRVIGCLGIAAKDQDRRFGPEELAFAIDVARRAALAVENSQLYREAQRANRAKDEFLATLSHELRTPMNVILGWLEILSTEKLDAETFELALTTLSRNANVQIQLINDLLDISRIISGKLSLRLQELHDSDLATIVSAGIDSVRPAARAKGISIDVHLPTTTTPSGGATDNNATLMGDPDRLQQVIWNLLSNAVKFTPEGGRIEFSLEASSTAVRLRVRDTGQGIDPHFLPYVFDRFRQEDGSTTRMQGGLGLGLSIVRYLVELHGGSVKAFSAGKDQGATFTITFPRHLRIAKTETGNPSSSTSSATQVPLTPSSQRLLSGVHVLLVDDAPDVRTLISRLLIRAGARVTAVESAREAFAILSKTAFSEKPDILISDIGLPEEDGLSLIRRVRELEHERRLAPIPAAALTAYAQEADCRSALAAGYDHHMAKPVTSGTLLATITTLVACRTPSKTKPAAITGLTHLT